LFAFFQATDEIPRVTALTIDEAKATLGRIARGVLRSKKPVIVRTSDGFIQIAPYKRSEKRTAPRVGSLRLLPRELELHNTFGDSL
jgi:hypothetical protein